MAVQSGKSGPSGKSGSSEKRGAHRFELRVYYEDTDLAGIVYHANYLKFIERGRSEWVRACGVDQGRLRAEQGIVFAVRRVEAEFLRPAVFEDLLEVVTELVELGGARIVLDQAVWRGEARLFSARVVLVCVGPQMGAVRIPAGVRAVLQGSV